MQKLKLGVYKHYKRKMEYLVIGIAKHSETLEDLVIYIPLYKMTGEKEKMTRIWVRPLKMFLEEVEVNGKKVPRFEYLGER